MKYFEFKPKHPFLQPYIEYYNSMQGDGTNDKKFISLPEGKIGMVFLLGGHTRVTNGNDVLINKTCRMNGLKDVWILKLKKVTNVFSKQK